MLLWTSLLDQPGGAIPCLQDRACVASESLGSFPHTEHYLMFGTRSLSRPSSREVRISRFFFQ